MILCTQLRFSISCVHKIIRFQIFEFLLFLRGGGLPSPALRGIRGVGNLERGLFPYFLGGFAQSAQGRSKFWVLHNNSSATPQLSQHAIKSCLFFGENPHAGLLGFKKQKKHAFIAIAHTNDTR